MKKMKAMIKNSINIGFRLALLILSLSACTPALVDLKLRIQALPMSLQGLSGYHKHSSH